MPRYLVEGNARSLKDTAERTALLSMIFYPLILMNGTAR